jgi:hypothetical protein
MQNSQLLDIFCASMTQFENAMVQLRAKEDALNQQSKRLIRIVMTALLLVFCGIAVQVWTFASGMGGVTNDINELTKNMGYTQGIMGGMSARVGAIEGSVQYVPRMVESMKGFNEKLPLFIEDISSIEQELTGFQQSMTRLDTSLTGMNGSMSRLNFQMQLMSNHTKEFGRLIP